MALQLKHIKLKFSAMVTRLNSQTSVHFEVLLKNLKPSTWYLKKNDQSCPQRSCNINDDLTVKQLRCLQFTNLYLLSNYNFFFAKWSLTTFDIKVQYVFFKKHQQKNGSKLHCVSIRPKYFCGFSNFFFSLTLLL